MEARYAGCIDDNFSYAIIEHEPQIWFTLEPNLAQKDLLLAS